MLRRLLSCASIAICLGTPGRTQDTPQIPVAHISLPDPAYIGMPIWMILESATGYKIHYPSSTTPNDFYCNEVEVQLDEHPVQPLIGLSPAGRNGPACGFLGAGTSESRLPIHLQYPLAEPGTYKVRFTRREYRNGKIGIAEQSRWTPLHLELAPPDKVERWLEETLAAIPGSPAELLGDTLPSLLASRDPRVLNVMLDKTYDSNSAVAGYAANSLALFDKEQVRARVLSVLKKRGPNEALGWLFTSSDIAKPIAAEIVNASLPYMRSPDPPKVVGALHVLSMLRDPAFHLPADTVEQISSKLESEVDFVIAQRNEQAASWLANSFGAVRRSGDRLLLWKLVDAGLTEEQSLICITWFRDPADLPRITAIVKQASVNNASDPQGYKMFAPVGAMRTQYGAAARPYLREILAGSKQTWVRTTAAQDLVWMNDRAGWQFFAGVLREHPFYEDEMVRWLKERFPPIRNAGETEVLNFLESKASTADPGN
jgi:hypothetical protein